MLLVLIAGGGLGWFALERQREARRRWVIATIHGSGSSLDYDGQGISRIIWFGGNANPASLPQKPLIGDEVDALGACYRLRELMMVSSVMTDWPRSRTTHCSNTFTASSRKSPIPEWSTSPSC